MFCLRSKRIELEDVSKKEIYVEDIDSKKIDLLEEKDYEIIEEVEMDFFTGLFD